MSPAFSSRLRRTARRVGLIGLISLALILPFELNSTNPAAGALQLTNVELALFFCLAMAAVYTVAGRRRQKPGGSTIPRPWLWLWLLAGLALILSGLLAPELKVNALKAAARYLSGMALALTTYQLVRFRREIIWIATALVLGGFAAASLGFLELLSGQALGWLNNFRLQPTVAGPFIRLAGPFNHANQMAMYIEATLPWLIFGAWYLISHRRKWMGMLLLLTAMLYLEMLLLTFSRSGFATIIIATLLAAGFRWRNGSTYASHAGTVGISALPWAIASAIVVILVIINTWLSPVLRLRLTSEGDNEWYDLALHVPDSLTLVTGETEMVSVQATNLGSLVWSSDTTPPIMLGGLWYNSPNDEIVLSEARWPLGQDVLPGQNYLADVPLTAPTEAGEYWLEWDLVQEDVVWFRAKNGLQTLSKIIVLDGEDETNQGSVTSVVRPGPPPVPIPDRRVLWRLAFEQIKEHPWFGIGLDNFRLTHGKAAGWPAWDTSIHSNNLYIETLVSTGLLGSIPFFVWLGWLAFELLRSLRSRSTAGRLIGLQPLSVGLLAFLIHGLLDYFLMFNGTALLFWLLVGLWIRSRDAAYEAENSSQGSTIE